MLFLHLVLFPDGERAVRFRRLVLPEYMGVAGNELFAGAADDVRHREMPALLLDEGVERRLHQDVARLLAHFVGIV